jgi:hypothetical protein
MFRIVGYDYLTELQTTELRNLTSNITYFFLYKHSGLNYCQ